VVQRRSVGDVGRQPAAGRSRHGQPHTGTAGADYLSDTDGKDVIKAGDGNDTIYLKGKGDDIVDGEGGSYNQA
jgi:Ca2+-binding RTX toxin-like protein